MMSTHLKVLITPVIALCMTQAYAGILNIPETAFIAGSGLITFSEFSLGTVNPTYNPSNYDGDPSSPTVTFNGYFTGQSLSPTPGIDCPGGSNTGCVVGTPTGPLSLDPNAPITMIASDSSNPTSPVLSGNPTFNGPIGMLFSSDQAAVGLFGGFFDAIGSTAITAFARDGSLLGSVTNTKTGIEFLGLVTDDGSQKIAGILFSLVGAEPYGYGIDNLRFARTGQVVVPSIPEPASLALLGLGLAGLGFTRRGKRA